MAAPGRAAHLLGVLRPEASGGAGMSRRVMRAGPRVRRPVQARGPGVNLYLGTCSDCLQQAGRGHGPVTGSHREGYEIHCKAPRGSK